MLEFVFELLLHVFLMFDTWVELHGFEFVMLEIVFELLGLEGEMFELVGHVFLMLNTVLELRGHV